jgi:hypothetical protein
MGSLKLAAIHCSWAAVLVSPALAQSAPTYGEGALRPQKRSAPGISTSVPREELPPGRGTPRKAKRSLRSGLSSATARGRRRRRARIEIKTSQDLPIWRRERILPLRSPFATTVWDTSIAACRSGEREPSSPMRVALTAYLLFVNR